MLLCLPLCAVVLSACGSATSTAAFKGEQHAAAQTIANLQADATAAEEKKICGDDLAAPVVERLGGTKGCEKAIKSQVAEIDTLEVSVQSVQLGARDETAVAHVKSTFAGKSRTSTVSLVKEGNDWKVSAFQ